MNKKILIAAVCGVAIAIPALAQMDHAGMKGHMAGPTNKAAVETMVKTHFAKVDANGDGFIVKAEAEGAREKMAAEMRDNHFKKLDANSDGSISRAEFDAQHGARTGGRDHGGEEHAAGKPDGHKGGHMRHGGGKGGGMGMGMMGERMFERADADKDGRVSLAEAMSKPMAHFDMMDANKDGTLTPEERKAGREKMRAEWRAKRS